MKSTNPSESVAAPEASKATQATAKPAAASGAAPAPAKAPRKRVAASGKKPMPIPMPVAKPAAKTAAVPAVQPASSKLLKPKKIKLVRDNFTIPKLEYLMLDALSCALARWGNPSRKVN